MVNRCARLAALTLVVVLTSSGCTRSSAPGVRLDTGTVIAEDRVVNVLNWSDYIAPDTIARFEEETGIKVNYDVFDSNEVLETKLLTGHTGYDVVAPSDFFLERQAKQGIFLPLDNFMMINYKKPDQERYPEGFNKLLPPPKVMNKSIVYKKDAETKDKADKNRLPVGDGKTIKQPVIKPV